jgi:hypothetical protein
MVASTVTGEPGELEVVPAPGTPIVTITPPAESTETFPSQPSEPEKKVSTIDEAISNFHDVVGGKSSPVDEVPETQPAPAAVPAIASDNENEVIEVSEMNLRNGEIESTGPTRNGTTGAEISGHKADGVEGGTVNGKVGEEQDEADMPPFRRAPSDQSGKAEEPKEEDAAEHSAMPLDEIDLN